MNSRSTHEDHTRFQTKMGKVYTRFQTKTAQNPTRSGGTYLYSLYKGVLQGVENDFGTTCTCGTTCKSNRGVYDPKAFKFIVKDIFG